MKFGPLTKKFRLSHPDPPKVNSACIACVYRAANAIAFGLREVTIKSKIPISIMGVPPPIRFTVPQISTLCAFITFAKEVMFLPVFVCLSVCLFVCVSER